MKKILTIILVWLLAMAVHAQLRIQTNTTGLAKGQAATNVSYTLQQLQLKNPIKSLTDVISFNQLAKKQIKDAIKPFGYFSSRVRSTRTLHDNTWFINFTIKKGPQTHINQVIILIKGAAQHNKRFAKFLTHLPIKKGDPLNTHKYTKLKDKLNDMAIAMGYMDSKMTQSKIIINLTKHTADIHITLDSGNRSRFGAILITHQSLQDHFIKKYLTFKQGQFYNRNKLAASQKNLLTSGYFSRVLVSPITDQATPLAAHIPIKLYLTPAPKRQYTWGAGYGTDTGFRGTIGLDFNAINSWGHKFNAVGQASQISQSIVFNYLIPYPNPVNNLITISGGFGATQIKTDHDKKIDRSIAQKLSVSYITPIAGWQQSVSLVALNEEYKLPSLQSPSSSQSLSTTTATLLYPAIQWDYKHSDRTTKPANGYHLTLQAQGTPNSLSTTDGFLQLTIDGKMLLTYAPTATRLLTHASDTYTSIDDLKHLPLSLQIYAGGSQSIRGYGYGSLGPAKHLALASIELQQKIYKDIYLAAFCDTALLKKITSHNIWKHIYMGAGPGIMWLSPIGMIELTFGYQVLNNGHLVNMKRGAAIQFSMGTFL